VTVDRYNHGGDILPMEVRIAHLEGDGTYQGVTISMNALAAHLAHGDYVPGTAATPPRARDGVAPDWRSTRLHSDNRAQRMLRDR